MLLLVICDRLGLMLWLSMFVCRLLMEISSSFGSEVLGVVVVIGGGGVDGVVV